MFPESNYAPPVINKPFGDELITFAVSRQLGRPVAGVSTRRMTVVWASVPKTAVDEYGHPSFREDDIRSNTARITDRKEVVLAKP